MNFVKISQKVSLISKILVYKFHERQQKRVSFYHGRDYKPTNLTFKTIINDDMIIPMFLRFLSNIS